MDHEISLEKPSFFERFHAWWEGYDLGATGGAPQVADPDDDVLELSDDAAEEPLDQSPDADTAGADAWPADTIEIVQLIWGPGFTSPGGPDVVLDLVGSLAATPNTTVLEVGSGLGGGARTIAEEYGARVSAWELDPDLAAEGAAQAKTHKLQDKALVQHLDIDNPEFPENLCQGALVRDALYRVEDKAALLTGVVGAIKSQRDLVITDFMTAGSDPALDGWIAGESGPVFLWDEDGARACLETLELDVRSFHDNTDAYVSMILRGLDAFTRTLQEQRPPRHQLVPTVYEVERWARLVAALESGALRHYWITAVKP